MAEIQSFLQTQKTEYTVTYNYIIPEKMSNFCNVIAFIAIPLRTIFANIYAFKTIILQILRLTGVIQ